MTNKDGIAPEVWDAAKRIDSGIVPIGQEVMAVFDAYYRAWRREGAESERERIIALLEAEIDDPADADVPNGLDPVDWYDGHLTGLRDAIALIRGENE